MTGAPSCLVGLHPRGLEGRAVGENLTEARTWVWWGLTPYRCDWTWNPETDLLKLECAATWWGRYGEATQKRFIIEQKALRDRLDRARLMRALAKTPSEYAKAADDIATEGRDRHASIFGVLAFLLLVLVCVGAWKLMRSLGWAIPEALLLIPAVAGHLIIGPAGDWYRRQRWAR